MLIKKKNYRFVAIIDPAYCLGVVEMLVYYTRCSMAEQFKSPFLERFNTLSLIGCNERTVLNNYG